MWGVFQGQEVHINRQGRSYQRIGALMQVTANTTAADEALEVMFGYYTPETDAEAPATATAAPEVHEEYVDYYEAA